MLITVIKHYILLLSSTKTEVIPHGLDPNGDNDGVSNIDEYRHGINPTFPQKETSANGEQDNYTYSTLGILGMVIIVVVIVAITKRWVR